MVAQPRFDRWEQGVISTSPGAGTGRNRRISPRRSHGGRHDGACTPRGAGDGAGSPADVLGLEWPLEPADQFRAGRAPTPHPPAWASLPAYACPQV